jgi:hypothetical protein
VRDNTDIRGLPLGRLGIGVKNSDSRAASYIRRHGDIYWEAKSCRIGSWLDHDLWGRRISEIERARKLL